MARELEGIIDYLAKVGFEAFRSAKGKDPTKQLENLWVNCGLTVKQSGKGKEPLKPRVMERRKREYGWDILLHLPDGLCPDHFRKKRKEIEFALSSKVDFEEVNGKLLIKAYRLYDYLPYSYPVNWPKQTKDMVAPVIIGYTTGGIEVFDLADGPHMSICGETRGGKSNLLNVLFATLIPNPRVTLNVIDMKRVDYPYLKGYANHAIDLTQAVTMVERLHRELFRRLDIFNKLGICKIQDYPGDDLPIEVLAIDEFSQISPVLAKNKLDKEVREYVHALLIDILCLAASVGIHVIVCTQRPDRDILPGQLKANIPAKICFHVTSVVNSHVALDDPRAAFLPKVKGRGIFKYDEFKEFQALHLPVQLAEDLVRLSPPKIRQPSVVNNVVLTPTLSLIP